MDKKGNPAFCIWGLVNNNPPLIPSFNWKTCSYVGTNNIAGTYLDGICFRNIRSTKILAGQGVYQYHMTNSATYQTVSITYEIFFANPFRWTTISTFNLPILFDTPLLCMASPTTLLTLTITKVSFPLQMRSKRI